MYRSRIQNGEERAGEGSARGNKEEDGLSISSATALVDEQYPSFMGSDMMHKVLFVADLRSAYDPSYVECGGTRSDTNQYI